MQVSWIIFDWRSSIQRLRKELYASNHFINLTKLFLCPSQSIAYQSYYQLFKRLNFHASFLAIVIVCDVKKHEYINCLILLVSRYYLKLPTTVAGRLSDYIKSQFTWIIA